ncbi:alpha/beta fold hydrolase [Enhygromyxa salina]|uniref:Alpha/beta hydrolase family protein n=1 Tax=Enhygromyxa salina TaxID=215803 RepID=A0A2S9XWV0_9BACT|nr:tetratricopeptide repeat protein [Enhygromyxa salina]PRP97357.1 Alpha/beta hydrolase family protein [Enhygromyxa salina]
MTATNARFATSFDGHPVAYYVFGDGPPLVMSTGIGVDHAGLWPQIEHFARSRRVIAWDYRGVGRSQPLSRSADVSVEAHARDLAAYEQAHAINPDRRVAINISFPLVASGRVDEALEWLDRDLAQHPDDIAVIETKAVTLIDAKRHGEATPIVERALGFREPSGSNPDRRWAERWREYLATNH